MLRTILITGARGALGQSVVAKFVDSGVQVVAAQAPGTATTASPASGPDGARVRWIEMDLASSDSIRSALSKVTVDGLVHCAGGFRYLEAADNRDEEIDFLLDVNLRSSLVLLRELVPGFKERGFGRVVFVGAQAALDPPAGMSAYAASKAGLHAVVTSVARELKAHDINVNAVLPSIIDTAANRRDMPKADFSKWVSPEALASIIFSLTQEWGKPLHGALIPVTGRV